MRTVATTLIVSYNGGDACSSPSIPIKQVSQSEYAHRTAAAAVTAPGNRSWFSPALTKHTLHRSLKRHAICH